MLSASGATSIMTSELVQVDLSGYVTLIWVLQLPAHLKFVTRAKRKLVFLGSFARLVIRRLDFLLFLLAFYAF